MDAFIKKNGVTVCPEAGSPELAKYHIEREKKRSEEAKTRAGSRWRKQLWKPKP